MKKPLAWSFGLIGCFTAIGIAACVGDEPTTGGDDTTNDGGTDGSQTNGDGDVPDSGCGDLTSSNDNCGACGNVCDAGGCFESVCGGHTVVSLAATNGAACALFASGHVSCWGRDDSGQLGVDPKTLGMLGGSPARSSAAEVAGITSATQLSLGKNGGCVVVKGGDVYCWGTNEFGALAHAPGTAGDSTCSGLPCNWTPSKVAGIPSPAVEVQVGEANACVRTADSHVYCWGTDGLLNLGQGNGSDGGFVTTPVSVAGLPSDLNSLAIANNAGHVCASANQALDCWGTNLVGELGHVPGDGGTPMDVHAPANASLYANGTPQPVNVSGAFPTKVIAAQGLTCMLDNTHALHCMGDNANGDLGNGTLGTVSTQNPTLTTVSLANVATMTSNFLSSHGPTCAINETGAASCWGSANNGQMGNGYWSGADAGAFPGITTNCTNGACYESPTPVPAMSFVTMAAGTGFVVALATDGHVYGWGANPFGETGHDPATLGDQSCTEVGLVGECAPSPVRIMSLP